MLEPISIEQQKRPVNLRLYYAHQLINKKDK